MESATWKTTMARKFLNGLTKCIEQNETLGINVSNWKLAKEREERLFKSEHGGASEILNNRPIPEEIISYCVGDVRYLPELRERFWKT